MRKNFLILISLILIFGNTFLWSQGKYSLASFVDQVLNQSPLLDSFKSRVNEKRFLSRQAGIWPNPEGSFSAGQKNVDSKSGPLYEMSLSQTFLFPGKLRSRILVAEADMELAKLSQLEAELFLIFETVRLAYDYEVNQRKKEFAQSRFQRFDLLRAYLEGNIFASPQKKAERRIVEARLREISAERFESEAAHQTSLEKLELYFPVKGKSFEIEVPWLNGNPMPEVFSWQTQALEGNPELSVQKMLIERARKEKDLAAREAWPDFESSLFYGRESAVETERTTGLGVSIPLPIFNRNQSAIKSLQKRIEAEEILRAFKERELASRLGILLAEIESARQTLLKYPLSLMTDLEKDFKESEAEFHKGRIDFLVFVELENELAETYYRALGAQKSLAEKLAALFALAGRKDIVAELSKF